MANQPQEQFMINIEGIPELDQPGMKYLKRKIDKFTESKLLILKRCLRLLRKMMKERTDCNNDEWLSWNSMTWFSAIVRTIESTTNNVTNSRKDCWLGTPSKSRPDKRPTLSVRALKITRVSARHGTRMISNKNAKSYHAVVAYKVFSPLVHYKRMDDLLNISGKNLQVSHRCKNKPQLCWNPFHTTIKTDADNKNMDKCWYGSAIYCPHVPKCIFTDYTGRYLPCRNNKGTIIANCEHEVNCHTAIIDMSLITSSNNDDDDESSTTIVYTSHKKRRTTK